MEIKTIKQQVKELSCLTVAYDVSKNKHNYMTGFTKGENKFISEGEIENRTNDITTHLTTVNNIAKEHGFHFVRIVCEPTGGYEKVLLRKAREMGILTEYVNGEATSKAKVIESNDASKNDTKDSRVIHMIATHGNTLTCNERTDVYGKLKLLNGKYEDLSLEGAQLKNRISTTIEELFPDIQLTCRQFYSKLCSVVIDLYGLNPYKIIEDKWGTFVKKIEKKYKRKLGGKALEMAERIYNDAKVAQLNIMPEWRSNELEKVVRDYYARRTAVQLRKNDYRQQMMDAVDSTKEWTRLSSTPIKKFMFSRLIAETGPWDDFENVKQLLRFGGLNLKERSSGKFVGKLMLSKKGNILMRKVLGQLTFSTFIKKGALYGEYYQEKKKAKGGFYGITCVMRKLVKMLFGVYKSEEAFNTNRVFEQHFIQLEETG